MQLPFDCPPHRSFVWGYNTLGFLSLEEVLPLITKEERHMFSVNGQVVDIKLSSIRLLPFIKSVKCYNPYCSEEGFIFAVQQSSRKGHSEYEGWHINLYSKHGKLMTCDHLIPKSSFPKEQRHGKANSAENLDTLCTVCNSKKLTDSVDVFLEKQKYASLYIQHQKQCPSEVTKEDFEGQTVIDLIRILKKCPPSMRITTENNLPAIVSLLVKPYAKAGSGQEPKQLRAFISLSEV